jgi:hypothetical protein
MNQLNEHDLDLHVKILGWLYILGNAIFLVVGITGFIFLTGIGAVSGDTEAVKVLGFIGAVGVLFFGVLGLPGIAAGVGLLKRQPWGRLLALVVGFLGLFAFPIGTAIGVYAFWMLLQNTANEYFTPLKPA